MKKGLLILLQLFILAVTVQAQTYHYTSTTLNLRSGPGTIYRALKSIPAGTSVQMAENCDCDWIKIYYKGETGYVSSRYLTTRIRQPTHYYTNKTGHRVQSPTHYNVAPSGATALCRDGSYSFSMNKRGTCSHHGGVARWLQ